MKKLFVGGLSWNTSEQALREAFERFGDVLDVKIITDRETGRSRGFGFVSYSSEEAADEAKSAMDGSFLDGRTIRVDEAKSREGGGGGVGGRRGGGRRY